MANILITSLGTGYTSSGTKTSYRTANYINSISGEDIETTPYIFHAISNLEKLGKQDKLILIGTVGSDWYNLYEYIRAFPNIKKSENADEKAFELLEQMDALQARFPHKAKPDELSEYLEPIRQMLLQIYEKVEIILIKYGLDDLELNENFLLLQRIAESVDDGDEIIFDITHSFRSLAFFELITVNYIREIVGKQVRIRKVSYGMYEVSEEIKRSNEKITPIIDLRFLLDTLDCMKAIEEFQRFGTTYSLCDLINRMDNVGLSKDEIKALGYLNENMSSNNFQAFRRLVKRCHSLSDQQIDRQAANENIRMIANKIFKDIDNRFYYAKDDEFLLQLEFARWHSDKKRYTVSGVNVVEGFITFAQNICEPNAIIHDRSKRDFYRERLNEMVLDPAYGPGVNKLISCFKEARPLRNKFAHPGNDEEIRQNVLKWYLTIEKLVNTYKEYFLDKDDPVVMQNIQNFRKALQK